MTPILSIAATAHPRIARWRQPIRLVPAASRRLIGIAAIALFAAALAAGPVQAQEGKPYQPARGQAGKDVVWIPTPDALVTRMLKLAQVTPQDYVVDLGAGDGKIVIAAARDFAARGLGLEYDPKLVEHAQRNAQAAGVADRAKFRQADIFVTDFSNADVVTMYLLPDLNLRLRPTLLAMKPGTRLVSHQFTLGNWQPDETSWVEYRPAYLWIVPANTGGTWQARYADAGGPVVATMTLEQTFQKVAGSLEFGPVRTGLRHPQLDGSRFSFAFTDGQGVLRQVAATVSGDRMQGSIDGVGGSGGSGGTGGTGEFSATRQGLAPAIGGSAPASGDELNSALRLLGE
jgi:SAM-dependent methyltransferase